MAFGSNYVAIIVSAQFQDLEMAFCEAFKSLFPVEGQTGSSR
jgi:hypothetical protein